MLGWVVFLMMMMAEKRESVDGKLLRGENGWKEENARAEDWGLRSMVW